MEQSQYLRGYMGIRGDERKTSLFTWSQVCLIQKTKLLLSKKDVIPKFNIREKNVIIIITQYNQECQAIILGKQLIVVVLYIYYIK